MKPRKTLTIAASVALLAATPAWALPGGVPRGGSTTAQGHAHPQSSHAPKAPSATAKAYGVACSKESKKHVAGQKGTPFSQCVTAMAKLATGKTKSPAKACAALSKKHVAGQKGTPYSQCISAAARLKSTSKS
jgi:hypothetical protein